MHQMKSYLISFFTVCISASVLQANKFCLFNSKKKRNVYPVWPFIPHQKCFSSCSFKKMCDMLTNILKYLSVCTAFSSIFTGVSAVQSISHHAVRHTEFWGVGNALSQCTGVYSPLVLPQGAWDCTVLCFPGVEISYFQMVGATLFFDAVC